MSYINNTPTKPQRKPKIQNSLKVISVNNNRRTKWWGCWTRTLFIQDDPSTRSTSTFKLLSTVAIPSDTSLLLDNSSMLSFDNSAEGYGLYLTVGGSDTLDVFINR